MRKTLKERFEEKFYITPGCWIWAACVTEAGYGQIGLKNKVLYAHRVSWELYYREIPDGLNVLHKCDVPGCVNPSHLFLGTHQDNTADMVSKGRGVNGELVGTSKLTENDIMEIRASEESQYKLAEKYGVDQTNISCIKLRKSWAHVI